MLPDLDRCHLPYKYSILVVPVQNQAGPSCLASLATDDGIAGLDSN